VLEDEERDRQISLSPVVRYASLKHPVHLRNSKAVTFSIDQPFGQEVVSVDPSGVIHALRAGKAIITGEFGGVKSSVVVIVYDKETAPPSYRDMPIVDDQQPHANVAASQSQLSSKR
jgi:hypothetical protein